MQNINRMTYKANLSEFGEKYVETAKGCALSIADNGTATFQFLSPCFRPLYAYLMLKRNGKSVPSVLPKVAAARLAAQKPTDVQPTAKLVRRARKGCGGCGRT